MEIRIGVMESQKEITLQMDGKPEDVAKHIDDSLKDESGVLWFVDQNGKRVGVPVPKLAYVEIEADTPPRPVGFHP
ncbi:MAG: DUF3107 domain-containing protein [Actinomycetota bacterium]|nr:DUF3107 domain-containing protein [Actinomycetota bacterium]